MKRLTVVVLGLAAGLVLCSCGEESQPACESQSALRCYEGNMVWFDSCGKPEGVKEGCPAGCNVSGCLASCTPQAEQRCVNGDMVWFDSCGTQGALAEDCASGCDASGCITEQCVPRFEKVCVEGDLYWFDSCGVQGDLAEHCLQGCTDGACDTIECLPEAEKRCVLGDVYWFDSCGVQGELFEDCATNCADGACNDGECVPEAEKHCDGDVLTWYDSCGNQGEIAESCAQGCLDDACVVCTERYEKRCVLEDLYWFDSCGNQGELAQDCEDGCKAGVCLSDVGYSDQVLFKGTWAEVEAFIAGQASEGLLVTSWTSDGTDYAVAVSKGAFPGPQLYLRGTYDEVTTFIKAEWNNLDSRKAITEWFFDGSQHVAVMTAGTAYTNQRYSMRAQFTDIQAVIQQYSSMELIQWFATGSSYVAVLSDGGAYTESKPDFGTWDYLQGDTGLLAWWNLGYRVTCLAHSDLDATKAYLVGLHSGSIFQLQETFLGTWEEVTARATERRVEGFYITDLEAVAEGQYAIVLSAF